MNALLIDLENSDTRNLRRRVQKLRRMGMTSYLWPRLVCLASKYLAAVPDLFRKFLKQSDAGLNFLLVAVATLCKESLFLSLPARFPKHYFKVESDLLSLDFIHQLFGDLEHHARRADWRAAFEPLGILLDQSRHRSRHNIVRKIWNVLLTNVQTHNNLLFIDTLYQLYLSVEQLPDSYTLILQAYYYAYTDLRLIDWAPIERRYRRLFRQRRRRSKKKKPPILQFEMAAPRPRSPVKSSRPPPVKLPSAVEANFETDDSESGPEFRFPSPVSPQRTMLIQLDPAAAQQRVKDLEIETERGADY